MITTNKCRMNTTNKCRMNSRCRGSRGLRRASSLALLAMKRGSLNHFSLSNFLDLPDSKKSQLIGLETYS